MLAEFSCHYWTGRSEMLITLSHRAAIYQSVAEFWLTGVAPLEAVSHIFYYLFIYLITSQYNSGGDCPSQWNEENSVIE